MGPIEKLITAYEERIAAVEEMMTGACQAATAPEGSLDALVENRERLKLDLQKTLARYSSLRRIDIDSLLEKTFADSNTKVETIREERRRVRDRMAQYLDEHKQLADYLRRQLVELAGKKTDGGNLNAMISIIRTRYEDTSQRLFAALREFQTRLDTFRREQENIISRLQKMAERGEGLTIEDLKRLEASRPEQEWKPAVRRRREEMERFLARIGQQRLENRCS
jgi:hypothetical protein